MSHPSMASTMKRLWANPEWRARQIERIKSGSAHRIVAGPARLVIHMDSELKDALNAYARRHNMSLAEIVRTFCEWGLETEKGERAA